MKELLKLDHTQDNIASQFGVTAERLDELRDQTYSIITKFADNPSKAIEALWNSTDKNNEKAFLILTFGMVHEEVRKVRMTASGMAELASIIHKIKEHGGIL